MLRIWSIYKKVKTFLTANKKGITLIELLIGLTISAIVIGLGYNTIRFVTVNYNIRSGQVKINDDLRLAMYWLNKDLQAVTPDKVTAGVDPVLYNVDGLAYKRVLSKTIGSRKYYNVVRETSSGGKVTIIESVSEEQGFIIFTNASDNYYLVKVTNIDPYNKERTTELKISRKNAGIISHSSKITGRVSGDSTITMEPPDNLDVSSDDNTWTVDVLNGTVKGSLSINDITLTGLPAGLTAKAVKGVGNTIIITVSGTASQPINTTRHLQIVVNSSAVTETGMTKSDTLWVRILPGVSAFNPNYYVSNTINLTVSNNARVIGDVMIAGSDGLVSLPNGASFYGRINSNRNMSIGNMVVGTAAYPVVIRVNGSLTMANNSQVNGDVYHSGTLSMQNNAVINGKKVHGAVNIPIVVMPELADKQWYANNGYTIVESQSSPVTFRSGGKYYFSTSYQFNYSPQELTDVIIVCNGDFTISGSNLRSGVIFAPKGKVTLNNNLTFVGSVTSNTIVMGNNSTLIYKYYTTQPYVIN
jgi:prepilin-type N-terminal cleavage/methylation domain-containing protein